MIRTGRLPRGVRHLTATQILESCMREAGGLLLGERISQKVVHTIVHCLRVELATQAELRSLPTRFVSPMADQVEVRFDVTSGEVLFVVPETWVGEVDKLFQVWTCRKCGAQIPGRPHPEDECRNVLVLGVMEL